MPSTAALSRTPVTGANGKPAGTLTHVLFHPETSCVVGIEVKPPAVGYVIERPLRYYAWDTLERSGGEIRLLPVRGSSGPAAARRLGIDWETTVIWDFQEVATESGRSLGQVADVVFSPDGVIKRIEVTGGMTADVAHGRLTIQADQINGFDGDRVRVTDKADKRATSGGVAAQAGKGAAVAKHMANKATIGAAKAGVKAARAAAKSDTGKSVARGWKSFAKGFKEGLHSDEK